MDENAGIAGGMDAAPADTGSEKSGEESRYYDPGTVLPRDRDLVEETPDQPKQPDQPATVPPAAPAPVAQQHNLTPDKIAAAEWAGIKKEVLEQLGWDGVRDYIAAKWEKDPSNPKNQKTEQPASNHPPAPPAPAVPKWDGWGDADDVDPRYVKAHEYALSQVRDLQAAMDKRLAELQSKYEPFEKQMPVLQNLIAHQQRAEHEANWRSFNEHVDAINAPQFFGDKAAPNAEARQQLGQTVGQILESGLAKDMKEAVQKAYFMAYGEQLQQQTVKQVAGAAAKRAGQAVAQPSHRDSELSNGRDKAIQTARQKMREMGLV